MPTSSFRTKVKKMEREPELILVLTTFPETEKAREVAKILLENRLAACCTILPGTSLYWWDEKLNEDKEVVMMIKTHLSLYPELEKKLKEIHPYQIPEIIALPIKAANQSYSDWIKEVTSG